MNYLLILLTAILSHFVFYKFIKKCNNFVVEAVRFLTFCILNAIPVVIVAEMLEKLTRYIAFRHVVSAIVGVVTITVISIFYGYAMAMLQMLLEFKKKECKR